MDKKAIYNRIKFLHSILQFTKGKTAFSTGERIMINQEIGSLLHKFNYSTSTHKQVSPVIEKKLEEQKKLIESYEWKPTDDFPYDDILKF